MSGHTERIDAAQRRPEPAELARVQQEIQRAIREVRFGSIEIVIHDSRVVQIERREKTRFGNP